MRRFWLLGVVGLVGVWSGRATAQEPPPETWRLEAPTGDGGWVLYSRMEATRMASSDQQPAGSARDLEFEIVVDRAPDRVIADWLDEGTVDRFFGVSSTIEPRVGGAYEIRFLPGDDAAARANATLGARVLALEPGRHLAFEWGLPPWVAEPARSAPRTRVDVRVSPATHPATGERIDGRTVLNLQHSGYGPEPAWDDVRSFFLRSWFDVLARYRALAGEPDARMP